MNPSMGGNPVNDTTRRYLLNNPFFSGLDDACGNFLAEHAGERSIAPGEILFRQGEHADAFYLLRDGQISVEIPSLYGPPLEIQRLGSNEVLGWSWLIAPYQWDFQARAEEACSLIEFDGHAVLARCEEDNRFGYAVLKIFTELMSERLTAARQRIMDQWSPSGFA